MSNKRKSSVKVDEKVNDKDEKNIDLKSM